MKFAEVVVVLLDVQIPFESQDLRLADLAEREGRAVVVAVNKWDLEEEKPQKLNELREAFGRLLPQLRGAPMVMVSALTGKGLDRLHDGDRQGLFGLEHADLDGAAQPLAGVQTAEHPPPAPGGRRIRLRYMTQVKTRPPTFVIFASLRRRGAGGLQALPGQRAAARLRHAGDADPALPALGREPLRRAAQAERDRARQAQAAAAGGVINLR